MTPSADPQRLSRTPWAFALAAMCFVGLWPLIGGMIAVNDDIKFVRVPAHAESLWSQIRAAWGSSPSFRPLELLVAASCDERTLRAPLAVPLQIAGLITLCLALPPLSRRIMPGHPWVAPMAMLWIALSPGTSVSAWQVDTISQTWSAALGLWAIEFAWRAFDAARTGRPMTPTCLVLAAIFVVGVNVKETFYGWSAGIGLCVIGAIAFLTRRERATAARLAWTLLPVIVIPVLHLVLRWSTGAMSRSLEAGGEGRYQLEFGMNLLLNAAQSVAGTAGTGPFHAMTDAEAPIVVRSLPILSLAIDACVLALALECTVLQRPAGQRGTLGAATVACVAGMISLAVTFPMGAVSELYGFGANCCVALLLASAVIWLCTEANSALVRRATASLALIAIMLGMIGLAGRAHHFERTWRTTRSINDQILAFMERRPAAPRHFDAPVSVLYFPAACRPLRSHGAYIMPAAQAIDILNTVDWMMRLHPRHPTTFSLDQSARNPTPYELEIDCAGANQTGHW
jgi:hypothetical protein